MCKLWQRLWLSLEGCEFHSLIDGAPARARVCAAAGCNYGENVSDPGDGTSRLGQPSAGLRTIAAQCLEQEDGGLDPARAAGRATFQCVMGFHR